jgi:hypothetical protein
VAAAGLAGWLVLGSSRLHIDPDDECAESSVRIDAWLAAASAGV